jgi:hypothetical protein
MDRYEILTAHQPFATHLPSHVQDPSTGPGDARHVQLLLLSGSNDSHAEACASCRFDRLKTLLVDVTLMTLADGFGGPAGGPVEVVGGECQTVDALGRAEGPGSGGEVECDCEAWRG